MDDQFEKDHDQNQNNRASSKNDGDIFNYDVDKSKEGLPQIKAPAEKQPEPDVKIEVISTVLISNKKEKQKKTDKKKLMDKKGSIV